MSLSKKCVFKLLLGSAICLSGYTYANCNEGSLIHMSIKNVSLSSMFVQGIGTDTSQIPVTNEQELKPNDMVTGDVCFNSVRGASLSNYSAQFALKVSESRDMKYAAEVDYNNIPFQQPDSSSDNDVNPASINQPFASSVVHDENNDNDCSAAHSQNCTINVRLLGE